MSKQENTRSTIQGLGASIIESNGYFLRASRSLLWTTIGDGVIKTIFVIITIYLARIMEPRGFGLFALGQVIGSYLAIIMDFSANSAYAVREIAQNRKFARTLIPRFLVLRSGTAIIVMAIILLIMKTGLIHNQLIMKLLFMGSLYAFALSFFPDWAFRGLERISFISIGYSINAIAFLIFILAVVRSGDDYIEALGGWALSYFLGGTALIIILRFLCRIKPEFHGTEFEWLKTWKSSLKFTLAGLLGISLSQGTLLFSGIFLDDVSFGLFAGPFKVILSISMVGMIIANSAYPILSTAKEEPEKMQRFSAIFIKYITLMGLVIALFMSAFPIQIIRITIGSKYLASSFIFSLLIWSIPIQLIFIGLEYTLLAKGLEGKRLRAYLAANLFFILAAVPLIKILHIHGAALLYLLSMSMLLVYLFCKLQSAEMLKNIKDFFVKLAIAGCLFISINLFFKYSNQSSLGFVAANIVFWGILYFTGFFNDINLKLIGQRIFQNRI